MIWIDYVILGVIGFSALVSLVRGFVKEALSLVIWCAAFYISSQYYVRLSAFFTNIENEMIRTGVAVGCLFVATLIVGGLINYIIGQLVQKTGLSGTDRVLGIVFGGLRGVLIMAAILFFMDSFTAFPESQWWKSSVLIPEFSRIIAPMFDHIKETSSFLSDAAM